MMKAVLADLAIDLVLVLGGLAWVFAGMFCHKDLMPTMFLFAGLFLGCWMGRQR